MLCGTIFEHTRSSPLTEIPNCLRLLQRLSHLPLVLFFVYNLVFLLSRKKNYTIVGKKISLKKVSIYNIPEVCITTKDFHLSITFENFVDPGLSKPS